MAASVSCLLHSQSELKFGRARADCFRSESCKVTWLQSTRTPCVDVGPDAAVLASGVLRQRAGRGILFLVVCVSTALHKSDPSVNFQGSYPQVGV